MKKYTNTAFLYLLASLVCGVFYREFTKYYSYNGETSLAYAHLHLFALGTLLMLVLGLYSERSNLTQSKSFKRFFTLYNLALPMMVIMLLIRGVFQTIGTEVSKSFKNSDINS